MVREKIFLSMRVDVIETELLNVSESAETSKGGQRGEH